LRETGAGHTFFAGIVFSSARRFFSAILFFSTLLAPVMLLVPGVLSAQVTVNNVLVAFPAAQRPIQNVTVGNSSENPVYVIASVERVLDPGEGGNKSEPSEDILVSPKTFSVEKNGQRAVRFLIRKQPQGAETVYRVIFTPQDRGFGEEAKQTIGGRTTSIRILTGMGVLVFVEPPNPVGDLAWERLPDRIVFKNSGNVHVELGEGKACSGESCSPVERKRVYAGGTFELAVDGSKTVTYLVRTGAAGSFESLVLAPLGSDASRKGQVRPAVPGPKR
jgi:P pilus assembly chaperone PapD